MSTYISDQETIAALDKLGASHFCSEYNCLETLQ